MYIKSAPISGILDPFSLFFVCVCIQMFYPGPKWLSYQECSFIQWLECTVIYNHIHQYCGVVVVQVLHDFKTSSVLVYIYMVKEVELVVVMS